MHHFFPRLVALLLLPGTLGVAACSNPAQALVGPSGVEGSSAALTAGQLAGTWTLTSLAPGGGAAQPAPPDASYTLTFSDDRVSARADCNICGGAFRVSGASVTVGPALACTRAACPTMQFETIFETILAGDSTASLDGRTSCADGAADARLAVPAEPANRHGRGGNHARVGAAPFLPLPPC
jgi:heat shock protein HslJ